jgi:hypothetical protein
LTADVRHEYRRQRLTIDNNATVNSSIETAILHNIIMPIPWMRCQQQQYVVNDKDWNPLIQTEQFTHTQTQLYSVQGCEESQDFLSDNIPYSSAGHLASRLRYTCKLTTSFRLCHRPSTITIDLRAGIQ